MKTTGRFDSDNNHYPIHAGWGISEDSAMLIDVRCPQCNQSVQGSKTDEVIIRKKMPKPINQCRHCGVSITLIKTEREPGFDIDSYHYTTDNPEPEEPSMLNEGIYCPTCGFDVVCVKVNPANMRHPDPTETYTLKCGHTVI